MARSEARMHGLCASVLVFGLLVAHAPAQKPSSEEAAALANFEKYIVEKDPATRADQVNFLAKFDSPWSARALIDKGLGDDNENVRNRAAFALAGMKETKSVDLVIAATKDKRPAVREGSLLALARNGSDRALEAIAAALATETDPRGLIVILQGLSAAKKNIGAENAAKLLRHKEPSVVFAAVDMLGATGEPKNADALNPLLRTKDWSQQTAVLAALAKLRAKSSVPAIIDLLAVSKGRIAAEACETLQGITGWEFVEAKRWQEWWENVDPSWEVPKVVKKIDAAAEGYGKKPTTYYDVKIVSKRVFFVIDISYSMEMTMRFKNADGHYETHTRLDLAKEQLIKTLRMLDDNTEFGILAFEAILEPWRPSLQKATKGVIDEAVHWVEDLKTSNQGQTEEGYDRGQTNTYAALKWVYGRTTKDSEQTQSTGSSKAMPKTKPIADTVFFLSDGDPSCGELTIHSQIVEQVKRYNQSSRVVINTVAIELVGLGRQLMADIATATGGKAVVIDSAQ
jgi:hypothetical protein